MNACCLLHAGFLAYSSALKMEATCSSETAVDFQQTTRRYTPEDTILQPWLYVCKGAVFSVTGQRHQFRSRFDKLLTFLSRESWYCYILY
jgi:hypothetical protein